MNRGLKAALIVTSVLLGSPQEPDPLRATASDIREYRGACDASAAARITDSIFVIASDEATKKKPQSNVLLLYRYDSKHETQPIDNGGVNLQDLLVNKIDDSTAHDPKNPEADIEGAARVEDRIYWIASHGHNKNGKERPDRRRLFATQIQGNTVTPGNLAYTKLLSVLASDPRLAAFRLAELSGPGVAPEDGGISIEGLAAAPDGGLLIGFRSPLSPKKKKALLVFLKNPAGVLANEKAKLGEVAELDLQNRGVRDVAYWLERKVFVILAGPVRSPGPNAVDATNSPKLFLWSGRPSDMVREVSVSGLPSDFTPESLIVLSRHELLVLSDDGDQVRNGKVNSDADDAERFFRSALLTFQGIW